MLGGGIAWPLAAPSTCYPSTTSARAPAARAEPQRRVFTVEDGPRCRHRHRVDRPVSSGERLLEPLRSLESPVADAVAPMSFVDLQRGGDAGSHAAAGITGRRASSAVSSRARSTCWSSPATCPSPYTQVVQQMHGKRRGVPTETAFAHRHDQWDCLMLTQRDDPPTTSATFVGRGNCTPHCSRGGGRSVRERLGDDEPDRVAPRTAPTSTARGRQGKVRSGQRLQGQPERRGSSRMQVNRDQKPSRLGRPRSDAPSSRDPDRRRRNRRAGARAGIAAAAPHRQDRRAQPMMRNMSDWPLSSGQWRPIAPDARASRIRERRGRAIPRQRVLNHRGRLLVDLVSTRSGGPRAPASPNIGGSSTSSCGRRPEHRSVSGRR